MHALGSNLFDRHGLFSGFRTRELVKKLKRLKPDIIHLHCIHGYYINYRILFEFLSEVNVPVVWTFHDCWPFTGHCAHFENAGCKKWMKGCHSCELLKQYPRSLFVDNSERNWHLKRMCFTSVDNMHLVAVSSWLGELVRQSFLTKYPIHVIYNGVDLSLFKPVHNNIRNEYGIYPDEILVLGVATAWGKDKGLDDFVKLSKEPDIRVILVGVSDTLKRRLPANMITINRTENQSRLAELYSAADIFVNPTYNDSFPTVNLEALACGTPVITYRTGGSPEAVTNETGVVLEKGDINGLMHAVRSLAGSSFKYEHSSDCIRRAEMYFDKDKQFDKYTRLYKELLNLY